MVRAGGSASRTISEDSTPDPGGGHHPAWKRPKDDTHGPRWTPDVHGFPHLGSLNPAEKARRDRAVLDHAPAMVDRNSNLDPIECPEGDESHPAPLGRSVKTPRQPMRPAGNSGSARRGTPDRRNYTMRRSSVRPLSVEAVELSLALAPEQKLENRRSSSVGSRRAPPTDSGGGGGDVHGGSGGSRIGLGE